MAKHNPKNERLKYEYLRYLREAKGRDESTLDTVAAAIAKFELSTKSRDFKQFRFEQAIAFKRRLCEEVSTTGKPLAKASVHSTLRYVRQFFEWLAGQRGFRNLTYSDAAYFSLSEKDIRVAEARADREPPTLDQIKTAIAAMPACSAIERRNRALIAFALLSGSRDWAIATFKLKHLDLANRRIDHDAREVGTKFSKSFPTFFFPVGEEVEEIFTDWVRFLRQELGWKNDDPLFPSTETGLGTDMLFAPTGLKREHWRSAEPIRRIFREAFERAGLPYFNPHSFRKTIATLGEKHCRTPEEFKAFSQNLGHDNVLTTLRSYGKVATHRQREIMQGLVGSADGEDCDDTELLEMVDRVRAKLARR